MTYQQIEIKYLERSPLNVRKTEPKTAMEEMKASILAHGLMQNLVVIPGKKKGNYAVIAGGRRLEALVQLRDEGKLPDDHAVPCRITDAAEAAELSLAENTVRQAMHPADEFEAFTALIDGGHSVEDIAQRFGKTRRHVEQRLKLGRAAPQLIEAYRAGEMTLEVLEAYTVTDDHGRQMQVFESLKGHWNNDDPSEVRAWLTEQMVDGNDKRVRFVGLDTYEKAGGTVKRDLFGDEAFLENPELLDALVAEKLKLVTAELEAEGWAWVTVTHDHDWGVASGCKRLQPNPVDAPPELLSQMEAVEAELEALTEEWEVAEEDDEFEAIREKKADAHKRRNALAEQFEAFLRFTPEQVQAAGCYAYIDNGGELEIERGLVKRENTASTRNTPGADSVAASADKPKGLPKSLETDLEAFRLGAAQAVIAKHPSLAFDLLVFKAAKETCGHDFIFDGPQVNFSTNYGGIACKEARDFVSGIMEEVEKTLPLAWLETEDEANQFAAFQTLSYEEKHQLLAFCVARTLRPKLLHDEPHTAYEISLAQTGANVADYWRPTADNFLSRVKSDQLLEIGAELFDESWAGHRRSAKKSALVSELDRAFASPEKALDPDKMRRLANWLPKGMAFGQPVTEAKPAKRKKAKKAA